MFLLSQKLSPCLITMPDATIKETKSIYFHDIIKCKKNILKK